MRWSTNLVPDVVHLATRNWLRREQLHADWTSTATVRLREVFADSDPLRQMCLEDVPPTRTVRSRIRSH